MHFYGIRKCVQARYYGLAKASLPGAVGWNRTKQTCAILCFRKGKNKFAQCIAIELDSLARCINMNWPRQTFLLHFCGIGQNQNARCIPVESIKNRCFTKGWAKQTCPEHYNRNRQKNLPDEFLWIWPKQVWQTRPWSSQSPPIVLLATTLLTQHPSIKCLVSVEWQKIAIYFLLNYIATC